MSSIQHLLTNQEQLAEAIEQLLRNYKKDSAERKTSSYIKKRVEALDAYWAEFQTNHAALCEFEERNFSYFSENHYRKTELLYNEVRTIIICGDNPHKSQKSPVNPSIQITKGESTAYQEPVKTISQGNASKTEEMLRKQKSNFKAFAKTLASINVDNINEKWEFEDTLKNLESRWKAIDTLYWEIDSENVIGEEDNYEEMVENYERQYNAMKKSINTKMSSVAHKETSTPQMELPTFSGSFQHWTSFKDLFIETIHSNPSLSSAQKMQHLKSKIKGEAERLVQHLLISSDNYQICWDILNNRYNNKKTIFNSHLDTILNLPTLQFQTYRAIKSIHDTVNESLNAIKTLGLDISTWDPMLVRVISQKLDTDTYNNYVDSLKEPRELPYLSEFMRFLESKFISLEGGRRKLERPSHDNQKSRGTSSNQPYAYKTFNPNRSVYLKNKSFKNNNTTLNKPKNVPSNVKCPLCKNDHGLFHCNEFIKLHIDERHKLVQKHNLCKNCLFNHKGKECKSEKRCRQCNAHHHTLLHNSYENVTPSNKEKINIENTPSSSSHVSMEDISETLLATALVKVKASDGSELILRALIDQGSQISLITESTAQTLGLPRQRRKGIIFGVGAQQNNCKGALTITCSAVHSNYTFVTEVYIMTNLNNNLPNRSFPKPSTWEYLKGIRLADPDFNISRQIDLLLGADVYSNIILSGIIKGDGTQPIAQQTHLGWILCGNMKPYQCNVVLNNLEDIRRFWAVEDVDEGSPMSSQDLLCLNQYKTETKRHENGRYVVRLPLHSDIKEKLGDSRPKAAAQFLQLEKKFNTSQNIAKDYKQFMSEYLELNHMQLCQRNKKPSYYLPHHCVQRADSTTTGLRVVFNASSKSTSGLSLNDLMYSGPNLQTDLMQIILKWRQYKIAFTADIEKMFRQILCHEDDQQYQTILWRDSPDQLIQEYALTTVTYGTKAAPFLAMMTLKQLANDERHNYPEAAAILESSFYMDDLLHSCDDLEKSKRLKTDLINLLKSGGFNLRKWSSNFPDLQEFNDTSNTTSSETYYFRHQDSRKTLGLRWNPNEDNFTFQLIIDCKSTKPVTKRILLSEISKMFDPLGWLSPVTTKLKLIFQMVWQEKIQWDDEVPKFINKEWLKIKSELTEINQLQIPRWLRITQKDDIELHGFCDSSENAYACVIYCKVKENPEKTVIVAAKSRLVPAKKTITLPRLELCAALLLSTLMKKVIECVDSNQKITIVGWSDSTAVLGWIQGDYNRWKPFVSNRVKKIIDIMPPTCWHYVKSSENPADCASRGILPKQLKEHIIWWHGPEWLPTYHPEKEKNLLYETNEELRIKKLQTNVTVQRHTYDVIGDILNRHSCLTRVTRIIAWILRAVSRNKHQLSNYLTLAEIKHARNIVIKHVQLTTFEDDISTLEQRKEVHRKSKLLPLNPFIDQMGLLRVGGRLKNANIHEDQKNPIIIPHDGHFTNLLIDHAHKMAFHGGVRLTSANLRKQYWIIGGNRAVKKRIFNCIKCRRHNPIQQSQLMGDLPAPRCNLIRPFYNTGVDYTGYIDIKTNKGRGIKTTKGYVAVFVCMATKAVHLELVSDLTSSAFLSALRRLAARRGTPRHMYSDNGTTFVGANKILQKEIINLKKTLEPDFFSAITEMEIEWHFIAPLWPSAGGLWEAAVKSLKYHLRRVIGEQKLTYEELSTLLTQLEACLNSRPLLALTEDSDDINYLTSSHFLSSGPNLTIVETETDERTRWQLVQKIFKDTWKRWQSEYLSHLLPRSKWQRALENMNIDDIVVIHDANPAGKWSLGRIIQLHPGKDGYIRVVTVKTKSGILKRPITKVSKLPVREQAENKTEQAARPKEPKEKRTKRSCNLIWAIISILSIMCPARCNYSLNYLNSNQSIYFDKVNDMHIVRDQWKLIVYYDMNPYWRGIEILKNYITSLDKTCSNLEKISQCDVILLQLRHGYTELAYYSDMLLSQQTRHRQRRGLVNGVGYLANSLFGILDEQFAAKYEKDINLIKENENHLTLLLRNQTSIVEAENNLLKRVKEIIEKQHKMYTNQLAELDKTANVIAKEVKNIMIVNHITFMSIIANNILVNMKNLQETLLDTVTEVHYGKFNIHLLSPEQLKEELSLISGQLSKDSSLPIDNIQTDLRKLYRLLRVRARMTVKYFIFEIKIPLVTRDNYEIYNLIPVPLQTQRLMVSIIPIASHVAINLQKDSYIPLSENELHLCLPYNTNALMCPLQQPIYHLKADDNLCVKNKETNQCETKTSICADMWTQLNKINTYLYFCCGQRTIKIICGSQVTAEQVNKAGIITLADGCIIKNDELTIYSHMRQTNYLTLQPDIDKVVIPPINKIFNLSIPQQGIETAENYELQSYENLQNAIDEKIEQQKRAEVSRDPSSYYISSHDVHQYVVLYLLAGSAFIAVSTYTWCRWRAHCSAMLPISPSGDRGPVGSVELAGLAEPSIPLTQLRRETTTTDVMASRSTHAYACVNKATSPVIRKQFSESDD